MAGVYVSQSDGSMDRSVIDRAPNEMDFQALRGVPGGSNRRARARPTGRLTILDVDALAELDA
jgi:hypothetical protein